MGPAGSVHMSLSDLSTYATEHLRGHLGKGKLLSAETYQRLHAPRLNQYAYGWGVKDSGAKTPYTIYWHNGSNTLWYALVVFIPEKNMVVAVTANDGDFEKAEAAAWEIVKDSVKQFGGEVDPASRETAAEGRLSEACSVHRCPLGARQTGGQNRRRVVYARLARRDRRRGHRGVQPADLRGQVAEAI